jgi:hypothetical protein
MRMDSSNGKRIIRSKLIFRRLHPHRTIFDGDVKEARPAKEYFAAC